MMMTMKNILWIVPALLMGGCAVDDTQTMEPVAHNGNVLTAVCESPNVTRSGMNADRKFVWKAGDAVGVMSSSQLDANIAYQLDPENHDMTQGRFVGGETKVAAGDTYYAYYPYTVNSAITADKKLKMAIPAVQTYEPGSFPTMANPSVSVGTTPDSYSFRNTCGFLEILIKGNAVVTEVILTAETASSAPVALNALSGSGIVNLAEESPVLVLDKQYGDNSSSIKINCGAGVQLTADKATPFIAVVPAGLYYAITVEIRTTTGEKYSYIRGAGVQVARNSIATFEEIDFTATPLTPITETNNTYAITTPAEWNWLAVQVDNGATFEGKTVLLNNDLDFNGINFIPMGCSANYMSSTGAGQYYFQGTLDGQNYTFRNIAIVRAKGRGRGIIGQSRKATIKNVSVENMTVTGPGKWTAGIVGLMMGGTMENCHVKTFYLDPADLPEPVGGSYEVAYRLGGLIGLCSGSSCTISNCSADGVTIKGAAILGGLIGSIQSASTLDKCSVDNVKIIHADKMFDKFNHYGSYNPPYYDSAAFIGEATAQVTATQITVGKWEIYDQTGTDCRMASQTFTALPYVGELGSNPVSVNGKTLSQSIPTVTTDTSIIGTGETIQTDPAN